jgi:hypothetical protein
MTQCLHGRTASIDRKKHRGGTDSSGVFRNRQEINGMDGSDVFP